MLLEMPQHQVWLYMAICSLYTYISYRAFI